MQTKSVSTLHHTQACNRTKATREECTPSSTFIKRFARILSDIAFVCIAHSPDRNLPPFAHGRTGGTGKLACFCPQVPNGCMQLNYCVNTAQHATKRSV